MRAPVLLSLLLLLPLDARADKDKAGLELGDEAPSFSLKVLNPKAFGGKLMLPLRKLVGDQAEEPKKAVVLSFSASYCDPCKKEMGELKALAPRLEKAGVLLAMVIIDTDEVGLEKMRKYAVDELGLPFPVVSDRFNLVARRYHAESLPHVVIIDAAGKVSWVHSGYDPKSIEEMMKRLGA